MSKDEFKLYVLNWAERIQVSKKLKQIRIRTLKTKIASCSSRGVITFDISILTKNKNEIDKVIVHELLHLRYPNHGKMFRLMLERYLNKN